jgi:hypothetical protein
MEEVNELRLQIASKKTLSAIDHQSKTININFAKVQAQNVVFWLLDNIELVDWTTTNFLFARLKEHAQAEGVSAGFRVDSESASDLSRGIGVSETAEFWEKVLRTSERPHVDLVPGRNGTGTRLMHADT